MYAAVISALLKLVIFQLFFSFVFISISNRCHKSSLEHALPDSPFASPEKSTESHLSEFPAATGNPNLCAMSSSENDPLLLATSTSGMTSI